MAAADLSLPRALNGHETAACSAIHFQTHAWDGVRFIPLSLPFARLGSFCGMSEVSDFLSNNAEVIV